MSVGAILDGTISCSASLLLEPTLSVVCLSACLVTECFSQECTIIYLAGELSGGLDGTTRAVLAQSSGILSDWVQPLTASG